MNGLPCSRVGILAVLLLVGCGDTENVVVTGTLYQRGTLYKPDPAEQVMIVFGEERDGKVTGNSFPVRLSPDGTFKVTGPNNVGIPPGKYRVGVQSMSQKQSTRPKESKIRDTYEPQRSPIQIDISHSNKNVKLEIE